MDNAEVVSVNFIQDLSGKIDKEWKMIGRCLKLSDAQLRHIESDNQNNKREQIFQMLLKWTRSNGCNATYNVLNDALRDAGRCDLIKSFDGDKTENSIPTKPRKTGDKKGKKEQFIKDIKETYADLYSDIQTLPFYRNRRVCVDKVFVDTGIEYKSSGGGNDGGGIWLKLRSYNSIFTDPRVSHAMAFLLYGKPGYGKSTLALQYVYDWCNRCSGSPLKEVEMLIFLRLRYLRGGMPIEKAIKEFLLPSDTTLTERDVLDIIKSCTSVVLVFDGLDEYSDNGFNANDDVKKIIAREMFRDWKLVLTTRPFCGLPKLHNTTQEIRLTGFDDQVKERYILKSVVDGNAKTASKILQRLQRNPILADICQVSLFFVMFAHLACDRESSLVLDSVTSFFRYVIVCLYEHTQIRSGTESTDMKGASIEKHQKLDKVAFESLQGNDQHLVWSRKKLVELIDEPLYNELVEIGILVEENVVNIVDEPGTSAADLIQRRKHVSFYHKLFCEWYAAHYVAEHVKDLKYHDVPKFFAKMDPFDLQYVYRIACGFNLAAAFKIMRYLYSIEGGRGERFAILCAIEGTGPEDFIMDAIGRMCFHGVVISIFDSLLLQRSTMQLLEIAARNHIPTEFLVLFNCFQSVDLSTASIRTTSGLVLNSRIPFKALTVYLSNREMTKDEAIDILQFVSMCPSLLDVWFCGCVPARVFTDLSLLSSLKSRKVTVFWQWEDEETTYNLNLHTGRWNSNDGSEPTEEDFERMRSQDVEYRKEWKGATHNEWMMNDRKFCKELVRINKELSSERKGQATRMAEVTLKTTSPQNTVT